MLTVNYRAIVEPDLVALRRGRGSLWRNIASVSVPVSLLVFVGVYLYRGSRLGASLVGAAVFAASVWSNLIFHRKLRARESRTLDEKAVEVLEVTGGRVLDIEPLGDDAPAYCIFVGDGKALLLVGQWLLEYESFPAESFRLHRWADTKAPIRMEIMGRPTDAEKCNVKLQPGHKYSKAQVVSATEATLQQDFDRELTRTNVTNAR